MKIQLTRERQLYYLNRYISDMVWRNMKLEHKNITYPDTYKVLNFGKVNNMTSDMVLSIFNLRDAWEFLIDNVDYDLDFRFIRHLHGIIARGLYDNPGNLRQYNVRITGVNYEPIIPVYEEVREDIKGILSTENVIDRAVYLFLYLTRAQIFSDGNKRTASLAASAILAHNNSGLFRIEDVDTFMELLTTYYETGDSEEIYNYILNNCIKEY